MSKLISKETEGEYILAISLSEMFEAESEDSIKQTLSSFSCKRNTDVHEFLLEKAIRFEKTNIGRTYIFMHIIDEVESNFIGYVTVGEKFIDINDIEVSNNYKRKLTNRARIIDGVKYLKTLLIGQIGRNDNCSEALKTMFNTGIVLEFVETLIVESDNLFPYQFISLECNDLMIKHYEKFEFEQVKKDSYLNLLLKQSPSKN